MEKADAERIADRVAILGNELELSDEYDAELALVVVQHEQVIALRGISSTLTEIARLLNILTRNKS